MNARAWNTCVVAFALVCCGALAAFAAEADDTLAAELRVPVAGNLAAYGQKDVDKTMSFVDTKSPDYETTKAALAEQFKDLDVKPELVSFNYIGHDDEFAVARVKTKTTGKADSGFVDNTVDSIVILHYQNGAWKIWSDRILGIDYGK